MPENIHTNLELSRHDNVGWIGTGVMGISMCGHLLAQGYPLWVYNRTRAKAETLLQQGAGWKDSPKELARHCRIIFTMVGYPADVEEVYFGKDGIFQGIAPDTVLVDMTTTKPSLAVRIDAAARQYHSHALDAPVSGGDVGARNASLSIMVGGERMIFDSVLPWLQCLGKNIVYQGVAGSGQHTKMCNQIQIAGTMIGMCEAIQYGTKAGLDIPTVLSSIAKGAAGCWSLDNLAPRILKQDFEPGFYIDHFVKDLEIALEESQRMQLQLPGLKTVLEVYQQLQSQGYGKKGTQALYLAYQ